MNPRERPGKRGLVFPPSYYRDQYTPAQEAEHERLQEAEGERAPTDCAHRFEANPGMFDSAVRYCTRCGVAER